MSLNALESMKEIVFLMQPAWRFFKHAYEGTRSLIRHENVLPRHPRESKDNYKNRVETAYGFGYSKAIVNLLTFYLFQSQATEEWGSSLDEDDLFQLFLADCDLYGTDFDVFLKQSQKWSSIFGHVGILIDKPFLNTEGVVSSRSIEQDIDDQIYPYISRYDATDILDWRYDRDQFNRPYLSYLKLREYIEETTKDFADGIESPSLSSDFRIRIWTIDEWALYEKVEGGSWEIVQQGINPLGEIPFVWLLNSESGYRNIGVSDLEEISKIDASIIRNLSQSEEIIDYAAFPMLLKALNFSGKEESDDTVGVTAVQEFDPDNPDSKPEWLESKVKEPIDAILSFITRKIEEIYRSVNTGGLHATEISTEAKSGVALQTEFQLLNANLAAKSALLEEAEKSIIYFWTLWQGQESSLEDVVITRPRQFDVVNLAKDLDSIIYGRTTINSNSYLKQTEKLVARSTLPENNDFSEIDEEIENFYSNN